MCTAITLQSSLNENFFGRTMDFSYDIQPHLYIVPENYCWNNVLNKRQIRNSYSFIGIGQQLNDIMAFFDGVNEKGFAAAALYFAGYAKYNSFSPDINAEQVASYDFLQYILGKCASIEDLSKVLKHTYIIGVSDPVTQTIAPLHWIASDKTGQCVVIEQTERGLELFNNPIGVMANSPDFSWHMTNLRNYTEVSPEQTQEVSWKNIHLTPFGQAGGTVSLPGGYTSPERFIRTSYLKTHIPTPCSTKESVVSCFRIMQSVSIPKGAVITARDTSDYTKYTAFINTNTCEYFVQTYENMQIRTAGLKKNGAHPNRLIDLGGLVC